jgi:hypothetical protein
MEQDPNAFQKIVGVVDSLMMDPMCGEKAVFHMCKWTLLFMWSHNTPCLKPEGLETLPP